MATYKATRNNDGTFSYGGATFRLGNDGNYQLKIMGMWVSGNVDPRAVAAIKALPAATTATQQASNVVSPDPTKGETWVSLYERNNPVLTYDQRTKSLVNGNQRAFVMEQAALGNDALPDGRIKSNTGGGTQYIDRSLYTLGSDNVWRKKTEVVQQKTPYQGLFSGDLHSYQNRKNWVAEHKDYLKEKGANINWDNYSGTAEQNLALKRLLGGFDEWNAAKQRAAVPAMSPAEKFVKDGYASGRPWQDAELQNMEGSSALYLNQDDYLRWQGLQFGLRQARPYEAPAEPVKPVLNPNAPRKDIYNPSTAVAPRAQVNPIVAAPTFGTEVGSGPTTPKAQFVMNPPIKRKGGNINYQKIFK